MKYEVLLSLAAADDLESAFSWYEMERAGLGWEFRNEIALSIEKILDDRVSYGKYYGDIKKIQVERFPYIIYFTKDEAAKTVQIGAVLHERRSPDEIKMRIESGS